MKRIWMMTVACCWMATMAAQQYEVPVSEAHEQMQTGQFEPTWEIPKGTPFNLSFS